MPGGASPGVPLKPRHSYAIRVPSVAAYAR